MEGWEGNKTGMKEVSEVERKNRRERSRIFICPMQGITW